MSKILWTDVAPRDGLQNEKVEVSTEDKLQLIRGLLAAGTERVEATSFVSPKWVPQLADAEQVVGSLSSGELKRIRVLIPNLTGLERALACGVTNVVVTIGVTETFNQKNINRSVRESVDELAVLLERAKASNCVVDVALSMCFGCAFEGEVKPKRVLELVREIAALGVDEIGLADTIGVATPMTVSRLCQMGLQETKNLAIHLHDTRGLGVANASAAYLEGVRRFDGSVGGVGGCPFAPKSTGNVCSEDALGGLQSLGAEFPANIEALCEVANQLSAVLGHPLEGKLHRAGVWKLAKVAVN